MSNDGKDQYSSLLNLWSSGIRDYHSLFSAYLTANSIFIAATVLLFKELFQRDYGWPFLVVFIIVCIIGCLITLQMAIALGRFSAQNGLIGWRIRGIERSFADDQIKILSDIWKFREKKETIKDSNNDPPSWKPNCAIKVHRKKWAIRSKVVPWLFLTVYLILLVFGFFGYILNLC